MQRITFLIYNKRLLLFVLLGALSGGAERQPTFIFSTNISVSVAFSA